MPPYSPEVLTLVFGKFEGHCCYCGKRIETTSYGRPRAKGAWEVDHDKPRSRRGTDHPNNLLPACVSCNRSKGNMTAPEYAQTFANPPYFGNQQRNYKYEVVEYAYAEEYEDEDEEESGFGGFLLNLFGGDDDEDEEEYDDDDFDEDEEDEDDWL